MKRHAIYGWIVKSNTVDLSKRYLKNTGVTKEDVINGLKYRLRVLTNSTDWMYRVVDDDSEGFTFVVHVQRGKITEQVAKEFGFKETALA